MILNNIKFCLFASLLLAISMLSIRLSGGWCPGGGSRGGGTDPSIAKAVSAVSACLEIEWENKTFFNDSESPDLESAILKIAKGLPKEKPILFFFGSSKTLPPKKGSKKAPALTKEAKKSQELAECFNDKSFKVQVALKFFNCYDIDVSDISKEESPVICHENAPILAIYYNGEILKSVTSCSSNRLYGLLASVLKNNKFDINNLNRMVNKPLRAFYDIERKLYFKESEQKRISSDYAKTSTKSKKTRLDKINEECSELGAKRDECKSKFINILQESLTENVAN